MAFRYKARGKRRIHQRPDRWQITACLPWLEAEIELVAPSALVCLGATAAQGLLGAGLRIGRDRGKRIDSNLAEFVTVTTHPSSILRAGDDTERRAAIAYAAAAIPLLRRMRASRAAVAALGAWTLIASLVAVPVLVA